MGANTSVFEYLLPIYAQSSDYSFLGPIYMEVGALGR